MKRASWKQASFRHKISIVNYNYGDFQDETISALLAELLSIELYSLRQQKSLTQEAMAERLRISSRAYSDLERGKYAASAPTLLFLFSMLEADAGSIRRLSRVVCSWVKIMGSGKLPEPYFAKKQNSAISVSIIGIEQF